MYKKEIKVKVDFLVFRCCLVTCHYKKVTIKGKSGEYEMNDLESIKLKLYNHITCFHVHKLYCHYLPQIKGRGKFNRGGPGLFLKSFYDNIKFIIMCI